MSSNSEPETKAARSGLTVVYPDGSRQPFLRGMVTHDLVRRGLGFELAYAVAQKVRDELASEKEVSSEEISRCLQGKLRARLGPEEVQRLFREPQPQVTPLSVVYRGHPQPFSRGLLARSIHAAGLELDRAYRLAAELEEELRAEGPLQLDSAELARWVGELLERQEGGEVARRYRLVRRLHRLPKPVVIYVGGASGTGKSTLSLELAPVLRIYRINATDTIRQVMRMVFSPAILPSLHTSSFEVVEPWEALAEEPVLSPHQPDFQQRVIASFEEQATRVCVGVRAVVERAIAEGMSVVVEGVHLCPPWIPFPDLEGACYQVPLVLASLNEERHRTRFLSRSHLGGRRAERYVESFAAIRAIHDYIVDRAEDHDVAILDTPRVDPLVGQALHLVTGLLEQRLGAVATDDTVDQELVPTLLLVVDGMADRGVRALGGRTPLQAARTPTLDRLAREGRAGLADAIAPGVVADTAAGTLALFGQSPLAMKRGPIEALGSGLALSAGDIALRGNLASLDDEGRVVDRRAGRIRGDAQELARALDRLPLAAGGERDVEVRVKAATEHRLAVVLRGEGLSSAIRGSDPGDGSAPGPPLTPEPENPQDERAVHTARVLALFEQEARRVLAKHPVNKKRLKKGLPPANAVLTRGPGRVHNLIPLEQEGLPLRLTCIAGDRTVLGIAAWLGARIVRKAGMTANLDTDLELKFGAAAKALSKSDLVILHLKGADIAAHDQRPDLKVEYLERVDEHLGTLLESVAQGGGALRVAVGSDHATLSESGQHAADPLPVVIWGTDIPGDDLAGFDEQSAGGGSLHRFPLQLLLRRVFED